MKTERREISHLVKAIPPEALVGADAAEKEHTRMYWDARNGQPTGRVETCQCCNRRRKTFRFNRYYFRCSECLGLTPEQAKEKAETVGRGVRKLRREKSRLAYPCIGGPLDGEHATTRDFDKPTDEKYRGNSWFREGGMYGHLADEYHEFNAGHSGSKRIGGSPTMVFIHKSKLLPLKAPRDR